MSVHRRCGPSTSAAHCAGRLLGEVTFQRRLGSHMALSTLYRKLQRLGWDDSDKRATVPEEAT